MTQFYTSPPPHTNSPKALAMAMFSITASSGMMPSPAPRAEVISENDMVLLWTGSQVEKAGGAGTGRPAFTDSAGGGRVGRVTEESFQQG